MNPAAKTFSHVAPKYARIAREIEDRLIKLIDAGEDLALYYHRPQLPKPAKNVRHGHALVIGDGGFRRRISIPSREFDQYSSAKNAVVVGFGGSGNDMVIRLMDVSDRRRRASAQPVPMPVPIGLRPATAVPRRRYAWRPAPNRLGQDRRHARGACDTAAARRSSRRRRGQTPPVRFR